MRVKRVCKSVLIFIFFTIFVFFLIRFYVIIHCKEFLYKGWGMLRLRVKHFISGVLSVSAWCVAFVFGHHYDAEAETPVVGTMHTCGQPGSYDSYNISAGYSFEADGTGVCVFVCKPGYATYIPCSAATHTGCSRAYTGTDYNSTAWYAWINTECSTGCAYSGYESTLDADTTGLTNAVYQKIGAGLYFYTGCKGGENCSYNGTPPQKCEGIRFYAKFDCGSGIAGSSSVRAVGAQVGSTITFPAASNCTAPAGQSFSQWIGS